MIIQFSTGNTIFGTNSIGGDPVVGVCMAGVSGGLGFIHLTNFQWLCTSQSLPPHHCVNKSPPDAYCLSVNNLTCMPVRCLSHPLSFSVLTAVVLAPPHASRQSNNTTQEERAARRALALKYNNKYNRHLRRDVDVWQCHQNIAMSMWRRCILPSLVKFNKT